MADDKKSFLLYTDLIHMVKQLDKEKAGELFLHILKYVNDEDPKTEDMVLNIAFEPIKQQLKRDLNKWEDIKGVRSVAGKKGGLAKQANARKAKQKLANLAVSVNGSVNGSVNKEKEVTYSLFYDEQILLGDENYKKFVGVLFGNNELGDKLTNVLKLPKQVTFKQFKAIYDLKERHNLSIGDYLIQMENWKDLKKKTSVQATILTWMRRGVAT